MLKDRQLTKFDLPALRKEIEAAEEEIDELENLLTDQRPSSGCGLIENKAATLSA